MLVLYLTLAIAHSDEPESVQAQGAALEVGQTYQGYVGSPDDTWFLFDGIGGCCWVAELTWYGEQPPTPIDQHARWLHAQFTVVDAKRTPRHGRQKRKKATMYTVTLNDWRPVRWPDAYAPSTRPEVTEGIVPFEGPLVVGQRYAAVLQGETHTYAIVQPGEHHRDPQIQVEKT